MKTSTLLPRCVLAVTAAALLMVSAGCTSNRAPTSPGPHQNTASDGKTVTSPGPHQ